MKKLIFFSVLVSTSLFAQTLAVGDKVKANGTIYVRSSAGGSSLGQHYLGDQGTITNGPVYAIYNGIYYYWYQVSWSTSPYSGWSANIGLDKVTTSLPGSFTLSGYAYCNTTPPVAPAVMLSWSSSSGATSYEIYRNGSYYKSITGTSFDNNTGISAGQSYSFYIKAINSAGSTLSNTINVNVSSTICGSPPGSFSLSVTPSCNGTTSQIALNWSTSNGATSYDVYRNSSLYQSGLTGTQFTNSSVTSGISYSYYVQAKNAHGSTSSNTASATAPNCQTLSAPILTSLAQKCDGTTSGIELQWTPVTGASNYEIYRNSTLIYTTATSGTVFWNTTGLVVGQTYTYQVKAKNGGLTGLLSNSLSTTSPNCSQPTLSVTPSSVMQNSGNSFSFTGGNYTPNGTVTRFVKYSGQSSFIQISSITANSSGQIGWTFTPGCDDPPVGTHSLYCVDVNSGKQSSIVNETVTANPSCNPVDNPPAVTAFNASVSGNTVTVSYSISDDVALARVELWRTIDSSGSPKVLGWTKMQTNNLSSQTSLSGSFSDSPINGTYWYGVHVVDMQEQMRTEKDAGLGPKKVIVGGNGTFAFLKCPIPNRTPYTAVINTVFDHSMSGSPYTANQKVVAYTGETGEFLYGQSVWYISINGTNLYGYKNANSSNFSINGNYSGGGEPIFLYYDGHPGIDYKTTDQSADGKINVLAAASGTAHIVAGSPYNTIYIDHGNGYTTHYLHLDQRIVTDGSTVNKGEVIGISGDKGSPGSPHLHFEVKRNWIEVDPYGWSGLGNDPYTRETNVYLWEETQTSFDYESYFTEASSTYSIPYNLLKAIAIVESGVDQSAYNSNDGGCGVMQLTGSTKTVAAQLLGVTENQLCENTSNGARLNILGGAAVLKSFICWASSRVTNSTSFDKCSQNIFPEALRDGERDTLKNSLEVWWWPICRYNGGGADTYITTTNYPYRIWKQLNQLILGNLSYPPLSKIAYLNSNETTPSGVTVLFNTSEISLRDDLLYPSPVDLGRTSFNGIRWTNGNFNAFTEVILHKNDGSVLPVELTLFEAKQAKNTILLSWQTATETNNYGFEIECLNQKNEFFKIGFVEGNGTTNAPHDYTFTDNSKISGKIQYRLKQIDRDGAFKYYGPIEVSASAPTKFALDQNYPNPFNPTTKIQYALPANSNAHLTIYNTLGQQVAELVNQQQETGWHTIEWNAANISSGLYFYRMEATDINNPRNRFTAVKKMLLIR